MVRQGRRNRRSEPSRRVNAWVALPTSVLRARLSNPRAWPPLRNERASLLRRTSTPRTKDQFLNEVLWFYCTGRPEPKPTLKSRRPSIPGSGFDSLRLSPGTVPLLGVRPVHVEGHAVRTGSSSHRRGGWALQPIPVTPAGRQPHVPPRGAGRQERRRRCWSGVAG